MHLIPSFRRAPIVLALLACACSSTLYLTLHGKPPGQPPQVLECAKQQITTLGYTLNALDTEANRVRAVKYDWQTRSADTQFRRRNDRLLVEIGGSATAPTALKIEAHTFAEYMTQRGPTEVEESASEGVKAAAQSILQTCGS